MANKEDEIFKKLEAIATAIEEVMLTPGAKVFIYGCGASGRLAK